MRKYIIPFAAVTLLAQGIVSANEAPEKRFALVIGNQKYDHYSPLNSVPNDIKGMTEFLSKKAGFEIYPLENATKKQMVLALNEFKEILTEEILKQKAYAKEHGTEPKQVVSLVYFSGHGTLGTLDSEEETYLVPKDAKPEVKNGEKGVDEANLLSARDIHKMLASVGTTGNLVFLDACRDQGKETPYIDGESAQIVEEKAGVGKIFRKSLDGVNKILPAKSGIGSQKAYIAKNTLVGYATSSGNIAIDRGKDAPSLYTFNLLENLKKPNLDLTQVVEFTKVDLQAANTRSTYHSGENDNDFLTSFRFISTNPSSSGWTQ